MFFLYQPVLFSDAYIAISRLRLLKKDYSDRYCLVKVDPDWLLSAHALISGCSQLINEGLLFSNLNFNKLQNFFL